MIYDSFGSTNDKDLLQRALEYSISEDVRNQDMRFIVSSIATGSILGRDLAWNFFQAHGQNLASKLPSSNLNGIVKPITFGLDDVGSIEDYFTKTCPMPEVDRSVRQALESIRIRNQWRSRDLEEVKKYLENKVYE